MGNLPVYSTSNTPGKPVRECQLDELWTCIAKKEARLTSFKNKKLDPCVSAI
jgi:hypothetical protein